MNHLGRRPGAAIRDAAASDRQLFAAISERNSAAAEEQARRSIKATYGGYLEGDGRNRLAAL